MSASAHVSDSSALLAALNEEQKNAVLHSGSPLLILAGAGSGKTRVITTKIAWLIREMGVAPWEILAVTFTNKAAREMAERARRMEPRAESAMLRTFHSFGAWFLRRNGELSGLDSGFVIYDDADSASLVSTLAKGLTKAEARQAARKISRAKDYFIAPEDPALAAIDGSAEFRELYARYEQRLAQIGNVDFGDLIKKPVEILRGETPAAQAARSRFSVIMVDEYQDANVAQGHLLKEISGAGAYVCVVGDDDQSIYRFRGAELRNILEFPRAFSGAHTIRLESNYRSTSGILRAAESVVARNSGRLGKTMRAERGGGEKPRLAFLPDQDEEAAFCAALVQNARAKNPGSSAYGDWAILYRTNAQSLGFEMEFSRRAIPYRVVGSLKFYEREEIKDALAFLAFVANQRDEVAFRRIVNKPARALGQATVDALVEEARAFGGALLDAARAASEKMRPRARKGILAFIKVIDDAKALLKSGALNMEESAPAQKKKNPARADGELAPGEGLSLCAYRLVVDSGLAEHHLERDEISGNQRIANLQELFNEATLFPRTEEGLFAFLERMELDRAMDGDAEDDASADRVTLITFHNTKGLEFRKVIMTGLENGIFPREDKRGDELEEERRLFYVGATRAMDELYMTCCARRRTFGKSALAQPSIFLREIDAEFMKVLGNAPYGFGASASAGSGWGSSPTQTQSQAEIESGWSRGQRLFHDDYGYGFVAGVSDSDEGPVVLARFETGREIRFLSEHQGGAFEKIGGDD